MIRYRYALESSGKIADVTELQPEERHQRAPYLCLGCGRELIANLGTKRRKHFSHRPGNICSRETYLHKLGKQIFYERYTQCLEEGLPFEVELSVPGQCNRYRDLLGGPCRIERSRRFDLTRYFREIKLEVPVDRVIPDVLLRSEDASEHLFIEFAVTHKCEPEKVGRGDRIIEIEIHDESDLDFVGERVIQESRQEITLFNFKRVPVVSDSCFSGCLARVDVFVVYGSGKAHLRAFPVADVEKIGRKKGVLRHEVIGPTAALGSREQRSKLFREWVRKAWFDNVGIRNCFNCKYHGASSPFLSAPIFCKLKRSGVGSNEAAICRQFRGFRSREEAHEADRANAEYPSRRNG